MYQEYQNCPFTKGYYATVTTKFIKNAYSILFRFDEDDLTLPIKTVFENTLKTHNIERQPIEVTCISIAVFQYVEKRTRPEILGCCEIKVNTISLEESSLVTKVSLHSPESGQITTEKFLNLTHCFIDEDHTKKVQKWAKDTFMQKNNPAFICSTIQKWETETRGNLEKYIDLAETSFGAY